MINKDNCTIMYVAMTTLQLATENARSQTNVDDFISNYHPMSNC